MGDRIIFEQKIETLVEMIQQLHDRLRLEMKQKWDRTLPLDELLSNRWDSARKIGFGEGSSIYHNSYIYGDVKVGKNTWIGPFTILDGSGGLTIGDYCSISAGVQIYSHDSVAWAISGGKDHYEYAPTIIGSRCYIGPNTVIGKGVNLGDGTIVGANSFVNRSFPSDSRIAGNPAITIG
jgi:acetyltransferase-like isoleucine patch superfamily enzyme